MPAGQLKAEHWKNIGRLNCCIFLPDPGGRGEAVVRAGSYLGITGRIFFRKDDISPT